jgi:hypothetical protein
VQWDRRGLEVEGFEGFVSFAALANARVPTGAGVYVVYRDSDEQPHFLENSSGGRFKRKDPTVPVAVLESAWVTDARVLNVGKAAPGSAGRRGLSKRLHEYRRFGVGEAVAHWGGRYIWQMSDSPALLVAWRETPAEDPRLVEQSYIADFVRRYAKRPFANLAD